MNLVDANVLIYAVNASDPKHGVSRRWLDDALNGDARIGLAWVCLTAFLRLTTKVGLFPTPLPVDAALDVVRSWVEHPATVLLEPTSRHLTVLSGLLGATGTGGNLVSDAHLGALAIEHGATIVSYDGDFGRFPGVRVRPPA